MVHLHRFLAALALLGCCAAVRSAPAADLGQFTLTALNIPDIKRGAGLALVLETPGGTTWLYDTGSGYPEGQGWAGDFNAGRDLILPFLKERNVSGLAGVMISHAHLDHFGGLLWLEEHFPIGRLVDSGFEYSGASDSSYTAELGAYATVRAEFVHGGKYLAAHAGDRLKIDSRLEVEVIAPPAKFFGNPPGAARPLHDPPAHYLVNANSLGIRIQHGSVIFYLPGDIQSEDINRTLLPSVDAAKLKCHILIAPGHGIEGSKAFAEATRPEVSIASVFPRYARTLKSTPELLAVGAKVYVTGIHGWVRVVSDGVSYTVTVEHPDVK